MIAGVEGVETDRIERARGPEPQRVDPLAAPADDRRIDRRRLDLFRGAPDHPVSFGLDLAAETDAVRAFEAFEFPGIAVGEPGFGQFDLPAIIDALAEHAVHVTDAIAVSRDVERREAFHEAGRQTPETAVAERGVGLQFLERRQFQTVRRQRLFHLRRHADVGECIAQQPPDQELHRQVIDALAALVVGPAGGGDPAIDDLVSQRVDRCRIPVVLLGRAFILTDTVAQHLDDMLVEFRRFGTLWHGDGIACH